MYSQYFWNVDSNKLLPTNDLRHAQTTSQQQPHKHTNFQSSLIYTNTFVKPNECQCWGVCSSLPIVGPSVTMQDVPDPIPFFASEFTWMFPSPGNSCLRELRCFQTKQEPCERLPAHGWNDTTAARGERNNISHCTFLASFLFPSSNPSWFASAVGRWSSNWKSWKICSKNPEMRDGHKKTRQGQRWDTRQSQRHWWGQSFGTEGIPRGRILEGFRILGNWNLSREKSKFS